MPLQNQYPYDVAISFAGEDRQIASKLFELLQARGVSVFYDFNQQADLWGKDLIDHLTEVYLNQARFCLILISINYPLKQWTQVERKSALARAFRQPEEYILPIRLDNTQVPGIPPTIGYLDVHHLTLETIANQVVIKLKKETQSQNAQAENLPASKAKTYSIPMPEVTRKYTQLEKDQFIEQAFEVMTDYFRQALVELKRQFPGTEADLRPINSQKFVARIYVQGALRNSCKIWLGNAFGAQMSIQYLEGRQIDFNQDNSMNDYLSVDDTGTNLGLKLSAMGIGVKRPDQEVVSPEEAALYLWQRFTSHLGNM